MGKNLIQQARGKGSPTYRAPSFRYKGRATYKVLNTESLQKGSIIDIIKCPGHSAPLAVVQYENGDRILSIAPDGISVGQVITVGNGAEMSTGNVVPLRDLPEGTIIFNIEGKPGDGGKFVRTSGTFARVVGHQGEMVSVLLPSKKQRLFLPECRATLGIIAGGGRLEKPFLKAGRLYHAMRAKNKLYPSVSGSAQNAVDHPFGNKRTSRKSKARPTPRNAPPGRKVGMIAARRTGRRKK